MRIIIKVRDAQCVSNANSEIDSDDEDDSKTIEFSDSDAEINDLWNEFEKEHEIPKRLKIFISPIIITHIKRIWHPSLAAAFVLTHNENSLALTSSESNEAISFIEFYFEGRYLKSWSDHVWILRQ